MHFACDSINSELTHFDEQIVHIQIERDDTCTGTHKRVAAIAIRKHANYCSQTERWRFIFSNQMIEKKERKIRW